MESSLSDKKAIACNCLSQMIAACDNILLWNEDVVDVNDYLSSPMGMQKMAASCMLIEGIGEGIKKIDRLLPGFLSEYEPNVEWRNIKGMRDHIAHGYFDINEQLVFDVVKNEIEPLRVVLHRLMDILS